MPKIKSRFHPHIEFERSPVHVYGLFRLFVIFCFSINPSFAYEVDTHELLTVHAIDRSEIGNPSSDLFEHWGIEDASEEFPNSLGEDQDVYELIQFGSRFEDDTTESFRPFNHFYDPQNRGRPLTLPILGVIGFSSLDWITAETAVFQLVNQDFSYWDASNYYLNAITSTQKPDRDINWGRMFQTMGHMVHHIQDMAQPQHVRNDDHCDKLPCALGVRFKPSAYEKYTQRNPNKVKAILHSISYPKIDLANFNTTKSFWGEVNFTSRKGLGDYTSMNFVSSSTNFTGGLISGNTITNVQRHPLYPSPGTDSLVVTTQSITDPDLLGPPGPNHQLIGDIKFVGTEVVDGNQPLLSSLNERTSSFSLFNAELSAYNAELTGRFTLNRFNYDATHKFLLPRAVAYGAGMIDYFFRGRIEATVSANGNEIEIKNVSKGDSVANDDLTTFHVGGAFEVYYDTVQGNRRPLLSLSNLAIPNNLALNETHTITGLHAALHDATDMAPNSALTILFDGNIGSERGLATSIWQPPELIPFLKTEVIEDVSPIIIGIDIEDFVTRSYQRTTSVFYLYKGAIFEHELHEEYKRNWFQCTGGLVNPQECSMSRSIVRLSLAADFLRPNDNIRLPTSFSFSELLTRVADRRITHFDPKVLSLAFVGLNLAGAVAGTIDGSFNGEMAAPRLVTITLPPLEPINAAWLPRIGSGLLIAPNPCVGTPANCPAPDPGGFYAENPLTLHDSMGTTLYNAINGLSYSSSNCTLAREALDVIQCRNGTRWDDISGLGGTWRIQGIEGTIYVDPTLELPDPF